MKIESDIFETLTRWSKGAVEPYGQSRSLEYDYSKTIYEHGERLCSSCD